MVFNVCTLPIELKNSVLDFVQVDDSIKLLRTSKQLKSLTLTRGGFPKRIDDKVKLEFIYSPFYNKDYPKIEIEITRHFKKLFKVSIDQKNTLTVDGYKAKNGGIFFWNFFNKKISMCRALNVDFGRFYQSPQEVKKAITFTKKFLESYGQILPNVKSYQFLELFGSANYCILFLPYFSTNFVENLKFQLHWDKKETLQKVLAHESFQKCKVLTWLATDKCKMERVSKIFENTSAKYLVADFECLSKLKKLWKQFGEHGIPERSAHPGIVVIKHDGIDEYKGENDFENLYIKFGPSFGLQKITANSLEALILKRIFERLSNNELADALPTTFSNVTEWAGKQVNIKKKPEFQYFKKTLPNSQIFVCALVLTDRTYGTCEMQVLMTTIRNSEK